MGRGRNKLPRCEKTGRKLYRLKELIGSYDKILDDPQWAKEVNIYDPKTVAQYARFGVPLPKVAAVENYIQRKCEQSDAYAEHIHPAHETGFCHPFQAASSYNDLADDLQADLMRLNHYRQWRQDGLIKAPYCYVPRKNTEKKIFQAIHNPPGWIAVEGETGTGKSMLLHKIHEYIFENIRSRSRIPLFIDRLWFDEGDNLDGTPIDFLQKYCKIPTDSLWELIIHMDLLLRQGGQRLVILLDNIDAEIHPEATSRLKSWLLTDAPAASLIVITASRPITDPKLFDGAMIRTGLRDFSKAQVFKAIDAHVDAYHGQLNPMVRSVHRRQLKNKYLKNKPFAKICRRPAKLRMIFESCPAENFLALMGMKNPLSTPDWPAIHPAIEPTIGNMSDEPYAN